MSQENLTITDSQTSVIKAYESNNWKISHQLPYSNIIVMTVNDINPETEKITPLTAYIDPAGSARIV